MKVIRIFLKAFYSPFHALFRDKDYKAEEHDAAVWFWIATTFTFLLLASDWFGSFVAVGLSERTLGRFIALSWACTLICRLAVAERKIAELENSRPVTPLPG